MRVILGWILALGLVVSPAMAGTGAAGDESSAATATNKPVAATNTAGTTAKTDAPAKPETSTNATSSTDGTLSAAAQPQPASPAPAPAPQAAAAAPQASPLSFNIGIAKFTPGGFMDLTNVFRSTTIGSGIGTSFTGVPYNNNFPAYGLSEDRFSAQNSRLTLRIDSNVMGETVVFYTEADFLGAPASNLNVTSNSNALRMRLYFVDVQRGKWEILGGQDWSMLTPNRKGIGFMPGDIFYSQDVDTNYQMGLVWERTPQFRFIFHPNSSVAVGLAVENAEQYVGSGVVLPTNFSNALPQVDAGTAVGTTPATPNLHPDLIAKIAFDHKIGPRDFHLDIAGIYKTFTVNTFVGGTSTDTRTSAGGGSINANIEVAKNFRIIENLFWSDGAGRDIGNVGAPDLIVRPPSTATGAFTVSPVHSGSGIGGFEFQARPNFLLYGYYSVAYIGREIASGSGSGAALTVCPAAPNGFAATYPGGLCGYGFPGSANSNNRALQEGTIGFTETFWRNPTYGALQLMVQGSYLTRSPWALTNGTTGAAITPTSAHDDMLFVNFRYALP